MIRQIVFFIVTFTFLMTLFVLLERTFSPTFQQCVTEKSKDYDVTTAEKDPSGIGVVTTTYVRCSGEFIDANEGAITALGTIIIAAFTGTLWYATSSQGKFTKEALAADKRAFVFADHLGQFWELDPATHHYNWRFRPHWHNSGDAPTRHMTMYVDCEVRNSILPANFSFTDDPANIGNGLIPPKSGIYGGLAPRGAAVSPQDIADAQLGKKFIYLWGWMKYSGVVAGSDPYITRFCWFVISTGDPFAFKPNTPGSPPTVGTLAFNTSQHTVGNCADDECKF